MGVSGSKKSTTVRADRRRAARRRKAALQLALVRARLAALQAVSPRRAARLALDLWCTPPDGAGRRQDDRTTPGTLTTVTTDAGARVVVETWAAAEAGGETRTGRDGGPTPTASPAEAGVVYLAHGWGGWRGQLGAFVEPLRAAGYRVVAFDAPSHGDSGPGRLGPRRSTMPELADALATVVREHGDATAVVAHSLGTATSVLAVRDGLPAERLVLVAAIADVLGELDGFADLLGLSRPTRELLRGLLSDVAGRPLAELDVRETLRTHPAPPALVVHDRADKEVPYPVGAALAAAWPEGELLTTEGLGHHRLLRDPEVVRAVVDYVTPVRPDEPVEHDLARRGV
ncbi:alpha/beta fold hydrolase [Cellulosimicrobium cellulans]|uniref:alpha/beta fold hydrolase n=1 Tax=Cellulosimicrobium cellulans TaxID=1710 RepID=UPI002405CDAB|nr:alpha/beta fold hydrolase [Cellulosimicrobium cellulans]MDF9877300.1 pimeloyl-ACP methyl ester carboxylesterase [Cellulosimicrobium cellulans]